MRNPTEQNYGKYIEGNGFLHLQKILAINMVKKLMDNATKTGIDGSKTASKWVIQKTTEATGDLIGNKIVDKTTSQGKTKSKEKQDERPEIYIPPEKKKQQIIADSRFFWYHIKIKYQKITNLPDTTYGHVPRFITKKWAEVRDQSCSAEDRYKPSK